MAVRERVAAVTGAASGIGRGPCFILASRPRIAFGPWGSGVLQRLPIWGVLHNPSPIWCTA
jgi:hypothetical protein